MSEIISELSSDLNNAFKRGSILRMEYKQYRDFYLGLSLLDVRTNNLIACRLWRGLYLPLGGYSCLD